MPSRDPASRSAGPSRPVRVLRATTVALLAATLPFLAVGCSAGSDAGVQRTVPGAAQTTLSSGPDGVSLSMKARNVDLQLDAASVRLDPSGTAHLDLTVRNLGPVAEHLSLVSVVGGGQATLKGGAAATGPLTTAGILLDSGSSTGFDSGPKNPSILLPADTSRKAGGTESVMLMFGIAGLVHLDLPVRAA
ncbi:hypothetical protein ACEZCY_32620 [Streptacidiphilus sp. N1-12]|uniref:Copper(I)-binding protein n=2 Tax=Streptacidiphilus alkalitolerans TaxID=3342712 RepID=A0ABV6WPE6_9ACTN